MTWFNGQKNAGVRSVRDTLQATSRSYARAGFPCPISIAEVLEQRCHLSASLKGGLLAIAGSAANDTINVREQKGQIVVTLGKRKAQIFKARSVQRLAVKTGDGNDKVHLST